MARLLRVQATRTFNDYAAKSVHLLEETKEVKQLVKGGYFEIIAIEDDGKPAKEAEPAEAPADDKPKPAAKVKAAKDV